MKCSSCSFYVLPACQITHGAAKPEDECHCNPAVLFSGHSTATRALAEACLSLLHHTDECIDTQFDLEAIRTAFMLTSPRKYGERTPDICNELAKEVRDADWECPECMERHRQDEETQKRWADKEARDADPDA